MRDVLYLAWRYLAYHKGKTGILIASIALITYLPIGLNVLITESARELGARAEASPLLIGARGSSLELVLSSLYFEADPPPAASYRQVTRVADSGLADPIPLYVRFRARGYPIVGTTLEYFDFRGLRARSGRLFAILGECVLGAEVARELRLGPGDTLVSSPESVFDLAGVYPLRMRVVGVLEPAHTPDDRAVFTDLKTTWAIEGLIHGHRDLADPAASSAVIAREGNAITANASVVEYNEISDANVASFHLHGEPEDYPVTGILAVARGQKSGVLLMGRYEGPDEAVQMVTPPRVMDDLLGTIFTVQEYVTAAIAIVGFATLATAALVFLLSLRLRRREIETMQKIGGSRAIVAGVLISEITLVLACGMLLAAGLSLATRSMGSAAIRLLLQA